MYATHIILSISFSGPAVSKVHFERPLEVLLENLKKKKLKSSLDCLEAKWPSTSGTSVEPECISPVLKEAKTFKEIKKWNF